MIEHPNPDVFLRVTVGAPILTRDDSRIGRVKEIRGRFFLVGTPLLQRDYWLSADLVSSAVPDAVVELSISRDQLNSHKVVTPEAA